MKDFTKPFESNVLSYALRAWPVWNAEDEPVSVAATAFSEARRRYDIADARLTLSLYESVPGPERDKAVRERTDTTTALKDAYLAAREAGAVRDGITPRFLTADDAALIAEGLRMALQFCAGFRPSQIDALNELRDLFQSDESLNIFVR